MSQKLLVSRDSFSFPSRISPQILRTWAESSWCLQDTLQVPTGKDLVPEGFQPYRTGIAVLGGWISWIARSKIRDRVTLGSSIGPGPRVPVGSLQKLLSPMSAFLRCRRLRQKFLVCIRWRMGCRDIVCHLGFVCLAGLHVVPGRALRG